MQNPFLQAGTIDPPAELRAALSSAIGPLLMVAGWRGNFAVMASQPAPGRVPFIIEFKGIDRLALGVSRWIKLSITTEEVRRTDKNREGYLDMNEREAAIPLLTATSGREPMVKL